MLSLADIPFERREVDVLLGLRPGAPKGDDFYEHGWARPDAVWLDDDTPRRVAAPLLVALHTPDDPAPGPLVLEFWVDDGGDEVAAQVPWARFARERLAAVLGSERDVVLALCNPLHVPIEVPAVLGGRTLHVADGDVTAWLDEPQGAHPRIRLTATRWRTARADRL